MPCSMVYLLSRHRLLFFNALVEPKEIWGWKINIGGVLKNVQRNRRAYWLKGTVCRRADFWRVLSLIMERGLIISAWWAATPDRNVTRMTHTEDLCRTAPFPRCPVGRLTSRAVRGGGGGWAGPRSKTLSPHKPKWKWRDAHKISGFTRFVLSPSLADETERPRVLFLPAVKWQKVRRQDGEWENRKKAYFFPAVATFSLSVTVANQNCNFYGACRLMSFHLFSFILFVVVRLWKLKLRHVTAAGNEIVINFRCLPDDGLHSSARVL